MIVAHQADDVAEEVAAGIDVDDVPAADAEPTLPSPTPTTQPPPPPQELPSISQIAQALEITKLKQRVRKLERKNKVKVSGLRRLKKVGTTQRVESSTDTVMDDQEDDVESKPAKLKKVVEVVTTAKLMTKVVTAAATITAATTPIIAATITAAPSAARRRKGVVIRDPKETATPSTIIHFDPKSKDKGKEIMDDVIEHVQRREKEDNAVLRYQALKRKPQIEAQARKNMMIYMRNMAGFKMDYFKGMSYDDIRPIFEKYFNSNVAFLEKTKEQLEEEESRVLKRTSESLEEKATKKQKLDEEVEELKKHPQIVPNDDDDVYSEATPLALKIPVPKNYSDDFLLTILRAMFEKPDVQAQIWKNQRDDLAGREKISIDKVHFRSDAEQSSLPIAAKATNLNSIVELVMQACFLNNQEIAPPPSRNTQSLVDELSSVLLIQLVSVLANGINIDYASIFWEDIVNKLNKRHREKVVPYTRFLSLLMMHKMKESYGDDHMLAICNAADPVVFKVPKTSFNAQRVPQGTKLGAKSRHKKHSTSLIQPSMSNTEATKGGSSKATTVSKNGHLKRKKESSSAIDSNPSQTSASTPMVAEMHKEDQQATGGPTSLGVTSEARANPHLSSGCDASADSVVEVNPGLSAPNDYIPQQQVKMEILLEPASNKLLVGLGDGVAASFQQSRIHHHMLMHKLQRHTKHQESIIKNQESSNTKTKTFANSDIQDLPSRYQVYQGRLLASFQDDAKYEHGGQDTRSQGGKRRSRQKDKDLKISDEKTKSKDNNKRLKIKDHKA
nr:ribosomal L1 domain-containing protein CG13096-like [Tanacetum cinerariifolium]